MSSVATTSTSESPSVGWIVSPVFDLFFFANALWLLAFLPTYLSPEGEPYIEFWHRLDTALLAESIPGLTWPTLTFEGEMSLFRGKREVRRMHLGAGHTSGDIVAWVPDAQVMMSGT